MNIQTFWRWLKGTRQGRFVLLITAFLAVLYFVAVRTPEKKVKPDNRVIVAKAAEPATKAEGYRLKSDIPPTGAAVGPKPDALPTASGHTAGPFSATLSHTSTFADAHLCRSQ